MNVDDTRPDLFDLTLAPPLPGGSVRVVRFSGEERLSRPFSFEILLRVSASDAASVAGKLLGAAARLSLGGGSGGRHVHGIIRRAEAEPFHAASTGETIRIRAWLAPRLWWCSRGRDTRIFQDLTARQIIDAVLEGAGIARRWEVPRELPVRSYCVQYQESDLDFIQRLLGEEGLSYVFDHGEDETPPAETVVFLDGVALGAIRGRTALSFDDGHGLHADPEHVATFRVSERVRAGSVLLKSFDFMHPSADLSTDSGAQARGGYDERARRVYDHDGGFVGGEVAKPTSDLHLAQHRRRAVVAEGESPCMRLEVGRWFDLQGGPLSALDGPQTVVALRHAGHNPAAGGPLTKAEPVYLARFTSIPAPATLRPKRPKRRLQQTLETATVVGPIGEEIHCDALGRIKVQFHWDLQGRRDERSSCWIRCMQAWAGSGWGFQFIPRIGMEVLVQFVAGDTDRPIVIGAAYNAEHPPPFPLPSEKTKSGIRTQSSVGAPDRYNEISFEDARDAERMLLMAQRDMEHAVGHDHRVNVGHDETMSIKGDRRIDVGGNDATAVRGESKVTVEGHAARSVDGDESRRVKGRVVDRIDQGMRRHVGGSFADFVGGEAQIHVEQDRTERVVGKQTLVVGDPELALGALVSVFGTYRISSSSVVTLEAPEQLVLQCGQTKIVMTPTDITLVSDKILLATSTETRVESAGATFRVDGDGYLNGKKVEIHSSGAQGIFDANASLDGGKVRLNCGRPAAASSKGADAPPPETQSLSLQLADAEGNAYAGKRFELLVEGVTTKGSTDGKGAVQVDVPKGATRGVLTLWVQDAEKVVYPLTMGELPPIDSVRGAALRLKNLRYYDGDIGDEMTPRLQAAIRFFQADGALEQTSELDSATKAKLAERAGS